MSYNLPAAQVHTIFYSETAAEACSVSRPVCGSRRQRSRTSADCGELIAASLRGCRALLALCCLLGAETTLAGKSPALETDLTPVEPPVKEPGLVIAANNTPGYPGGELFRNGVALPADRSNDLAFITYMSPPDGQPESAATSAPGKRHDQGQIFHTSGTIGITADTLAQSVTVGILGKLAAITMQWKAEMPDPAPLLNLGLLAGGDPSSWKLLSLRQVDPAAELPVDANDVFTWDLSKENLVFAKGDQFTFTLSAEPNWRDIALVSARDIGVIKNNPEVMTRDCGYSAQFDGRSIWFFGDTILRRPNADNQNLLCNSWTLIYDADAGDGLSGFQPPDDETGAPLSLVPLTEKEIAFNLLHQKAQCEAEPCGVRWAIWPGTVAVDEAAKLAYVFYHKVFVEPGNYNFTTVGHSVAILKNLGNTAERPEFNLYEDYPTLLFSEDRDGFGSAAVAVDNLLYIYGCEVQVDDVMAPCRLARVPFDKVLDRDAWQFYQGQNTWSNQLASAITVFRGSGMMSVFYSEYLARYVAIYSQPLSNRVMMRTAGQPQGPWSQAIELFEAKETSSPTGWVYDALAHPELSTDNGRSIYVTYSRHTARFQTEIRLVEVKVALSPTGKPHGG